MGDLRNLPTENPEAMAELIDIRPGRVVSMALSKNEHCGMSLFGFSEGEGVSEEQYFGDTFYYVLEGDMPLVIEDKHLVVKKGECICVPAGKLHAIGGKSAFKMLQITVE